LITGNGIRDCILSVQSHIQDRVYNRRA